MDQRPTNQVIAVLRNEVRDLRRQLEGKEAHLKREVAACPHQWSEPKYDPIVVEGGWVEGDAPGTMGVDYRPGYYASGSETPRWKRRCLVCGEEQITTRVDKVEVQKPRFETRPVF